MNLMHNLFTIFYRLSLDNLWVICGAFGITQNKERNRLFGHFDISKQHRGELIFYRKWSMEHLIVSIH